MTKSHERPILFTPWSVSRILPGDKVQTRRVIKVVNPDNLKVIDGMIWHRPEDRDGNTLLDEWREWKSVAYSPYGSARDRLWIKEAWRVHDDYNGPGGNTSTCAEVEYQADNVRIWQDIPEGKQAEWFLKLTPWVNSPDPPWCKSMFMPRWASRITLELDEVRVERVQDMVDVDAIAEGIPWNSARSETMAFARLWDKMNKKHGYGWDSNPWVNVLTFHIVERRDK